MDHDHLVLAYAHALLTSTKEGATACIDADVRDPDKILQGAARTLDFNEPVALVMAGVLSNVEDDAEARRIVRRLADAVPSGSYLLIIDGADTDTDAVKAARLRAEAGDPYRLRSPQQIEQFFEGLQLLEPGVVSPPMWRPDPGSQVAGPMAEICGVARKPPALSHGLATSTRPPNFDDLPLRERNCFTLADRLGWPQGVAQKLREIQAQFPRWDISFLTDDSKRGPGPWYTAAWHRQYSGRPPTIYAGTEIDLIERLTVATERLEAQ